MASTPTEEKPVKTDKSDPKTKEVGELHKQISHHGSPCNLLPVPALMSSDGITDLPPGKQNNSETAITLDQLEQGMVPVGSIQIEQIEADGTTTNINSVNSLADVQAENNIKFSVVMM